MQSLFKALITLLMTTALLAGCNQVDRKSVV